MGWIMSMFEKIKKRRKVMFRPYSIEVCGLRSKARTITGKKELNKQKKLRRAILVIAKTTRQTAEWLFKPPKVPQCQPLRDETKSVTEVGSRRIADQFRDDKMDPPKLQDLRMLRTNA
uniref:Uncharacterized protein n=1 Tax=Solanum tuberosum TaxID=4113 RepID=M1DZD4_SOLTU